MIYGLILNRPVDAAQFGKGYKRLWCIAKTGFFTDLCNARTSFDTK